MIARAGAAGMNPLSSSAVGFRLLFRRPLIPLAEIAWRWTLAAAAWVLAIAFLLVYFDSLTVHTQDRLLLYTGDPTLVAQAIRRIFSGSSARFVEAGILLALGLGVAWIVLASLGRMAILRSILEQFGWEAKVQGPTRPLFFLNFLRAAALLAAQVAAIGAVLMASSFWASTHIRLGNAARLVFLTWFLIWLAWAVLNWAISAAAIFVVKEGYDSLTAIGAVLRLFLSSSAGILSASAVFGVIHLGFLGVSIGTALIVLAFAIAHPLALPLVMAVVLGYSFLADFLYTGRLAAYAYLAMGQEELPFWMASRRVPPPGSHGASSSVDKGELILSDLPSLV
jgi:hypothetical protein